MTQRVEGNKLPLHRFGRQAPHIPQPRPVAPGLGVDNARDLPAENVHDLESTTPSQGFYGVLSRTRFPPQSPPVEVGHGYATTKPNPSYDYPDPAEHRPGPFAPLLRLLDAAGILNYRDRTSDLGMDDRKLIADGLLNYHREGRAPLFIAGTYAADLPRWTDAGPVPRATMPRRYTLRREFEQDAQTFPGQHTVMIKRGAASSAVHHMGPPRTNRLTYRDEPASFGSKTVSLNG